MLQKLNRLAVWSVLLVMIGVTAYTDAPARGKKNTQAIERLKSENPGAQLSMNSATETVSFVRLKKKGGQKKGKSVQAKNSEALAFVGRHAEAFGQRVAYADVKLRKAERDRLGRSHLSYSQDYGGVPVFGASLKVHFDEGDELAAVTGTLIPDIDVSIAPSRSAAEAEDTALNFLAATVNRGDLAVRSSQLMIFRKGLARGVPGDSYLAYQVEIGNGVDVREFLYIDAHTGKYIDQITGMRDALHRQVWDGQHGDFNTVVGIWFGPPTWKEGDPPPPTGSVEADNMILASKETYDVFANAFGRDSYDGAGHVMDSIYNRGYSCPNASWNGFFISFCPGLTTDDVTGHEWGHAYTDFTDDLIYQWQPGALNESYSDVVGETVDRINMRDDLVAPDGRTDGACTIHDGAPPPTFTVDNGAAAGSYFVTASANEPPPPFTV